MPVQRPQRTAQQQQDDSTQQPQTQGEKDLFEDVNGTGAQTPQAEPVQEPEVKPAVTVEDSFNNLGKVETQYQQLPQEQPVPAPAETPAPQQPEPTPAPEQPEPETPEQAEAQEQEETEHPKEEELSPVRDGMVYVRRKDDHKQKNVFTQRMWDMLDNDKSGWEIDYKLPAAIKQFRQQNV
jgi:hypothetical protein